MGGNGTFTLSQRVTVILPRVWWQPWTWRRRTVERTFTTNPIAVTEERA